MQETKAPRVIIFIFGMLITITALYISYSTNELSINATGFITLGGLFMGVDPSKFIKK